MRGAGLLLGLRRPARLAHKPRRRLRRLHTPPCTAHARTCCVCSLLLPGVRLRRLPSRASHVSGARWVARCCVALRGSAQTCGNRFRQPSKTLAPKTTSSPPSPLQLALSTAWRLPLMRLYVRLKYCAPALPSRSYPLAEKYKCSSATALAFF